MLTCFTEKNENHMQKRFFKSTSTGDTLIRNEMWQQHYLFKVLHAQLFLHSLQSLLIVVLRRCRLVADLSSPHLKPLGDPLQVQVRLSLDHCPHALRRFRFTSHQNISFGEEANLRGC